MRLLSTVVFAGCLALAVGCDDDDEDPLFPADAGPVVRVAVLDDHFDPQEVTIDRGTTIVWTNGGQHDHTVTAGENPSFPTTGGSFDHELEPGESFEWTFDDSGDQPYFCRFHFDDGMTGTIIVR